MDLQVAFSDAIPRVFTFSNSNSTLAQAQITGNNIVRVTGVDTLNGGLATFTVQSENKTSNQVDVVVYGKHGVIKGRIYSLRSDIDTAFGNVSGPLTFRTDLFNNFGDGKASRTTDVPTLSGNTQYYEMDPALPLDFSVGTQVRWNIERGGRWYPDFNTGYQDAIDNGGGGKFFSNRAQ